MSGTAELARVVVDRTSGDEKTTEQSPKEQLAMTVEMASRGGPVIGSYGDANVSGTVPWEHREGLQKALALARATGAVLYAREPSRLSRFEPCRGMLLLETIPDLEIEGSPQFSRRGGAWVVDTSDAHLTRFVGLWMAWNEKRHVGTRTQQRMDAIKDGTVKTKSGDPPGRPEVKIDPVHIARARVLRSGGASWTDVREAVLELRGYNDVKDPEAKAKRDVSVESIKRALGAKPLRPRRPGHNADPGTIRDDAASAGPVVKGSLVPSNENPKGGRWFETRFREREAGGLACGHCGVGLMGHNQRDGRCPRTTNLDGVKAPYEMTIDAAGEKSRQAEVLPSRSEVDL